MMRPLAIAAIPLLAVACSQQSAAPAAPAADLDLPDGRIELTVEQRGSTRVPGSNGRLILRVGDITGGRVEAALITPPMPSPLHPTMMAPGDEASFQYGEGNFTLALVELQNALFGQDFATFEIAASGTIPRPPKPFSERDKIERLLAAVQNLDGATFIRNGNAYSGSDAAAHMRRKLGYAGSRIKTAEQFIEHLATRSSQSGEPYVIRFQDGREVLSAEFLREELKKLEEHVEQ